MKKKIVTQRKELEMITVKHDSKFVIMIKLVHLYFRETTVLNQRIKHRKHSVPLPALTICREAPQNVASTNFTTMLVTVTLLTVI